MRVRETVARSSVKASAMLVATRFHRMDGCGASSLVSVSSSISRSSWSLTTMMPSIAAALATATPSHDGW